MGNKKQKKNSNYKQNFDVKNEAEARDKRKNLIITIVCSVIGALFVAGMIIGIVASTLPKLYYVEMDFGEYGSIVIEVDGKEAPRTADNFMKLVNDGFYDGLTIFRAQKDFVIQGGRDFDVNLAPIVGVFRKRIRQRYFSSSRRYFHGESERSKLRNVAVLYHTSRSGNAFP